MTPSRSLPPLDGRLPVVADAGGSMTVPEQRGGVEERRGRDLRRALTVAKWTDSRFLDPLIGLLLPGVGDVAGAAAGLYIVAMAVRHRAPRSVVARMLVNLSVDCVGGVLPGVGDIFDALNRANLRNAKLLEQHLNGSPEGERGLAVTSGRSLAFSVAMLVGAVGVALAVAYAAVRHWWR